MTATLMQLRRRVRSRIGVPTSDQFFPDDVIDDNINLALGTLDSEHNWPWYETYLALPVSADVPLVMPPDWRTTRSVFIAGSEVEGISSSDLMRWSSTATGMPSVWAEVANTIELRPVPDQEYTVQLIYYRQSTPLVEDNDALMMPAQYAGAVISKACELLSFREDDRGAAEAHGAEYNAWVIRMRRTLRRSTGPITPRVREGSWI